MFISFWRLGNQSVWVGNQSGADATDIGLETGTANKPHGYQQDGKSSPAGSMAGGIVCSSDLS